MGPLCHLGCRTGLQMSEKPHIITDYIDRWSQVIAMNYSLRGLGGTLGSNYGNKFEGLSDRGGHGGHKTEDFWKNIAPIPSYRGYRVDICLSLLGDGTSNKRDYLKTRFFELQCL